MTPPDDLPEFVLRPDQVTENMRLIARKIIGLRSVDWEAVCVLLDAIEDAGISHPMIDHVRRQDLTVRRDMAIIAECLDPRG